jgi:hypothetical protein
MIEKVISGGQMGADRIGLEVASELGLETGGTAPKGYRTSRGPDRTLRGFGVAESSSGNYPQRTKANIEASDGTVIFAHNLRSPGSRLTIRLCEQLERPYIVNPEPHEFAAWVNEYNIVTINIAGNRSFDDISYVKEVIEAGVAPTQ